MKDLSMHILDIAQNSVRAKADEVGIAVHESLKSNSYKITITDNGCGMSPELLKRVTDPFATSRKARNIGLGLPLLQQQAELTGGNVTIESELNKGTKVCATFQHDHIDRQTIGDLAGSITLLMTANEQINILLELISDHGAFTISSKEIQEALEDMPLSHPQSFQLIKELIQSNIDEIKLNN